MHAPSNATVTPTYASSSLFEDDGTTAPMALLSAAATAVPMARSTANSLVPPMTAAMPMTMTPPTTTMPSATLRTSFVKLICIYFFYIYHYVDCANHAFSGPNHDHSVGVDAPATTPTPQLYSTTSWGPLGLMSRNNSVALGAIMCVHERVLTTFTCYETHLL